MKMLEHEKLEIDIEKIPLSAMISAVHRSYATYLHSELKDSKLTIGQYPFLINLYHEDNKTQKELADEFKVTEGNVTKALRKLEDNDLVERKENENNRREKIITITEKGKKIAKQFEYLDVKWEKEVLYSLNKEEIREFKLVIDKIFTKSLILLDNKKE